MDFPAGAKTASDESRRLAGTLAEVARGDSAAMADLYARTSAKLFGICLRVLGNRSEAEEALQETYVAVWRNAAAFDAARASPITWLAIVSRNKAIDRLRSRRPAQGLEAAAEVADERALASELIEDEQERGRLTTCIEELEERQRDAIRSAFLDGATYSDLAERDGVPLGTMKSWIRRGLLRLRGCLER